MARILVIDENASIRVSVEFCLTCEGHEVLAAANGTEGLRLLEAQEFDHVILDVHLPALSGLSMLKAIKANPVLSHLSVVVLTSTPTKEISKQSADSGVRTVLTKPFDPEHLRSLFPPPPVAAPPIPVPEAPQEVPAPIPAPSAIEAAPETTKEIASLRASLELQHPLPPPAIGVPETEDTGVPATVLAILKSAFGVTLRGHP